MGYNVTRRGAIGRGALDVEEMSKQRAPNISCQRSSGVEQRFRKPSVVSSNLTAGSEAI